MRTLFKSVLLMTITTFVSGTTIAQNQPTPEERAYKFRTSLFQTFDWKLGQMVGAKSQDDAAAFAKHAADLAQLSGMIEEGFQIENSLPEGTKAKPEIWEDYEKFQSKAQVLTDLATSFAQEGAMVDFDPRKFGSKTCGGCHRDFKNKD